VSDNYGPSKANPVSEISLHSQKKSKSALGIFSDSFINSAEESTYVSTEINRSSLLPCENNVKMNIKKDIESAFSEPNTTFLRVWKNLTKIFLQEKNKNNFLFEGFFLTGWLDNLQPDTTFTKNLELKALWLMHAQNWLQNNYQNIKGESPFLFDTLYTKKEKEKEKEKEKTIETEKEKNFNLVLKDDYSFGNSMLLWDTSFNSDNPERRKAQDLTFGCFSGSRSILSFFNPYFLEFSRKWLTSSIDNQDIFLDGIVKYISFQVEANRSLRIKRSQNIAKESYLPDFWEWGPSRLEPLPLFIDLKGWIALDSLLTPKQSEKVMQSVLREMCNRSPGTIRSMVHIFFETDKMYEQESEWFKDKDACFSVATQNFSKMFKKELLKAAYITTMGDTIISYLFGPKVNILPEKTPYFFKHLSEYVSSKESFEVLNESPSFINFCAKLASAPHYSSAVFDNKEFPFSRLQLVDLFVSVLNFMPPGNVLQELIKNPEFKRDFEQNLKFFINSSNNKYGCVKFRCSSETLGALFEFQLSNILNLEKEAKNTALTVTDTEFDKELESAKLGIFSLIKKGSASVLVEGGTSRKKVLFKMARDLISSRPHLFLEAHSVGFSVLESFRLPLGPELFSELTACFLEKLLANSFSKAADTKFKRL